jgi:hypothetical protein
MTIEQATINDPMTSTARLQNRTDGQAIEKV